MPAYSEPRLGGKAAAICMIGKSRAESLAAELLSMIFLEVISTHERDPILILPTSPESVPQENEVATKPLHILTHVCRYWRDVALGNPALWRRVHGRRHDQMQVFLERSHPLTVALFLAVVHWGAPEEEPMPAPMESVIKTHSTRLRRLDLLMVPSRQNISLSVLASLRATHLEVLTITSPCVYHSSSAGSMDRSHLLNGETSPLKALAIMPIIDWIPSCTPFYHLTHLISFDADPGLGHPLDVLELLSNVPVLAFLHVDTFVYDVGYSGSWHPPSGGVPLPQLRSLVFTTCSYKLIHVVVSHLLLPDDVFIRIQGVLNDLEDDGYPTPFLPFALRPVTFLEISMEHEQVCIVADGPASGFWLDGWHDGVMPFGWTPWLLQLHHSLNLSHVTSFHIHLAFQSTILLELLVQLPEVSHLAVLLSRPPSDDTNANHVEAFNLEVLCFALIPATRDPAAVGSVATAPAVRCPRLHTLLIEWEGTVTVETAARFARIPEMLNARAHAGHPICRVILQAVCHAISADMGTIAAPDLSWGFAPESSPDETEYEIIGREDGVTGLCALRMRDVWKVEGEEKYWEVGEREKAGYTLRPRYRW